MEHKSEIRLREKHLKVSGKIKTYCKSIGIRCPVKKLLVADHLQNMNSYADAPTIYVGMRTDSVQISHAAVYEALRWLTHHGFIDCEPGFPGTRAGARYKVNPDFFAPEHLEL